MKAGDLLIFNTLLAHGIRPNTSTNRARIAQYISMYPADETNGRCGSSDPSMEGTRSAERDRIPGRPAGVGEDAVPSSAVERPG